MTAGPCVQDVAFLSGEEGHVGRLCLQLNCSSDCVHVLRSIVCVMCGRAEMCAVQSNRVALAVDELYANIAEHAYAGKPGKVEFEASIIDAADGATLVFDFRDYASLAWQGCLQEVADRPVDHSNICPGGLGLSLITAVADACEHDVLADGNFWRLIFKTIVGDHDER
ncbi:MAG: ATP-binding protein [Mariprofundus sp.]